MQCKLWQKCHHFKNLHEGIKSLKAASNNSRQIDSSNWLTLEAGFHVIADDRGYNTKKSAFQTTARFCIFARLARWEVILY